MTPTISNAWEALEACKDELEAYLKYNSRFLTQIESGMTIYNVYGVQYKVRKRGGAYYATSTEGRYCHANTMHLTDKGLWCIGTPTYLVFATYEDYLWYSRIRAMAAVFGIKPNH